MTDMKAGDRVVIANPEDFLQPFRDRYKNRVGVVEKITLSYPSKKVLVAVRLLKRGNRGKEFVDTFSEKDLSLEK